MRWPIRTMVLAFGAVSLILAAGGVCSTLHGREPQQGDALSAPATPSPLYVTTFIDLLPQNAPAGTALIKQYALETRKDGGNRACTAAAQVAGRANHLVVLEEWQDEAAFHRHEAASHTREYRAKMLPLIGAPFDEREYFLVQ